MKLVVTWLNVDNNKDACWEVHTPFEYESLEAAQAVFNTYFEEALAQVNNNNSYSKDLVFAGISFRAKEYLYKPYRKNATADFKLIGLPTIRTLEDWFEQERLI